jgi:hypothetical protein
MDAASVKFDLKPILIRKGFKRTVRFKKNYSNISKIFKKRYSFRKIKNSNFLLILNSFAWAKFYLNLTFYEKKNQFKKIIPFSSSINQKNFKAHMLSNVKSSSINFMGFSSKSKKPLKSIKISNSHVFFCSPNKYDNLLNFNWGAEIATKSFKEILNLRKIMVICILMQLSQKKDATL